jgi:hypothetical protein
MLRSLVVSAGLLDPSALGGDAVGDFLLGVGEVLELALGVCLDCLGAFGPVCGTDLAVLVLVSKPSSWSVDEMKILDVTQKKGLEVHSSG